jgi:hypothetical protein
MNANIQGTIRRRVRESPVRLAEEGAMKAMLLVLAILAASQAFAQNSTTNTDCRGDGSGNGFNCTATTKADTPPPNAWADVQKRLADQRAAQAATRQANAALAATERAAQ